MNEDEGAENKSCASGKAARFFRLRIGDSKSPAVVEISLRDRSNFLRPTFPFVAVFLSIGAEALRNMSTVRTSNSGIGLFEGSTEEAIAGSKERGEVLEVGWP